MIGSTIRSRLFDSIDGLQHGFTTRFAGDMRQKHMRGLVVDEVLLPVQRHTNQILSIEALRKNATTFADGCINERESVAVGVLIADCVPILLVDPKKRITCAVHAGWKGTLNAIAVAAVAWFSRLGSNPADIMVAIGPHIGPCCYTVGAERIQEFSKQGYAQQTYHYNNEWHLDIGSVNREQLMRSGVLSSHVDAPIFCTSCQNNIFYSYRKDSEETFGEMLGYIQFGKKA